MRKTCTFLVITAFSGFTFGQMARDSISLSSLKLHLEADGNIDHINGEPRGKDLVWGTNLRIGGVDTSGTLRASAQAYKQWNTHYFPGPRSNDPNAWASRKILN